MTRRRKQGELSVYLPDKLYTVLEEYAENLCLGKSATARMIINKFFSERYNK